MAAPRRRLARLGALALILASTAPAQAQPRVPQLNPLTSLEKGLTFAIEQGCLPLLRTGADVVASVGRSGVKVDYNRRPGVALFGRGRVYVQDAGRTGCYVRVERADAKAVRQLIFEILGKAGYTRRVMFDPGEADWRPGAPHRQEIHCLSPSPPDGMVLSTSVERKLVQLTLIRDPRGPCAAPAPPVAPPKDPAAQP